MASIEKIGYGVVIRTNSETYNFPLNAIILDADDSSGTIDFKLKSYRRTILSIHYKDFTDYQVSNAQELAKIIQNTIIYI